MLTDAARPTGSRVPLTWVTRSASRRRKGRESSHSYLPRTNKSTHWQRSIGNWFSGVSICSSSMYFRTLTLLVSRRSFLRTLILSKCYLSSGATRIKEVMENILHPFPIFSGDREGTHAANNRSLACVALCFLTRSDIARLVGKWPQNSEEAGQ